MGHGDIEDQPSCVTRCPPPAHMRHGLASHEAWAGLGWYGDVMSYDVTPCLPHAEPQPHRARWPASWPLAALRVWPLAARTRSAAKRCEAERTRGNGEVPRRAAACMREERAATVAGEVVVEAKVERRGGGRGGGGGGVAVDQRRQRRRQRRQRRVGCASSLGLGCASSVGEQLRQ